MRLVYLDTNEETTISLWWFLFWKAYRGKWTVRPWALYDNKELVCCNTQGYEVISKKYTEDLIKKVNDTLRDMYHQQEAQIAEFNTALTVLDEHVV